VRLLTPVARPGSLSSRESLPLKPSIITLTATVLLLAAVAPATAQSGPAPIDVETAPRPEVIATRTSEPIALDGVLDEAAWAAAPVISDFTQSKPDEGHPLTQRTEVRILYDETYLYIGAEMWDTEPDRIIIPSLEQDFQSGNSDIFGITLDTFLDRRNAFMFLVNAKGAVKEAQDFDDSRQENAAWEGIFEVRTRIHDRGWTVEWAIPFTTLRFDPRRDPQDWGMQLMRRIRRNNEEGYWAPLDRRDRIHKMSKAGTLRGLDGIRSGRNLLVKPYALSARADGEAVSGEWSGDAGLDVKYGLTPKLTMDLTYRTDFSQVEVDRQRVNLTRFSLFFPERRDFFTENSGVFSFGDISERNYRSGSSLRNFTLFHSRRIGLDAGGQEVPIMGGGRITGRAGGFEIGALDMQTRAAEGLPEENFAVLRAKRTVEGVGDFGGIVINRQATDGSGGFNRSYGFEANLRPARYLKVNSYLAATSDSEEVGSAWAGRVWAGWRDPFWNISASAKRVGEAFVPRVGFVRRRGVRQGYATVGVHPRPEAAWLNEVNPYVEIDYLTDLNGSLLTRERRANLNLSLRDGSGFGFGFTDAFERVEADFDVAGGSVPLGNYAFQEASVSARSSAGRALSGSTRVSHGGFFNGDRTSVSLSARWRVDYHLAFDGSVERNAIDLPDGDFSADVYAGRATYAASTRFFTSAYIQYNALTDVVVTNLRINYIHASLSDLFLVYTERRDRTGLRPPDRLLSLKVTKALAF
jgi:Domain of unknown function (DUF5916)/Carbohydrate family 9 binding domain-like